MKRPSLDRTAAIISPPWGTWIRNAKIFFREHHHGFAPGRSAARNSCVALRCRAISAFTRVYDGLWSGYLQLERNRDPGSAKQRFARATRRIAPGKRERTAQDFTAPDPKTPDAAA